ncbi:MULTISPECIES: RNA-binding protein [Spirulina sp. CCY15215]|uniref:RNA recognition motif domain-containing protein n=1 Tax=Spirulina sp. CCY15215 TaxID=2767591 RepID=UPI001952848C|nr:RNA-binding protein [Spirulina major]
MSIRLYVGNLPKESVDRQALHDIFEGIEGTISTKVIKDRKTGKCRGFAFVTVSTDEAADTLIEKYNGQTFMESPLKIEKALPRAKKSEKESEGETSEESPQEVKTPTPSASKRSSSGGGKSKQSKRTNPQGGKSDSVQPDPRWATELSKLKEMLAAQTTNS